MLTLSALLQTNRAVLRTHCAPGDVALDATMGNGRDTVFLAELVGPEGLIIAMDKQPEALTRTADLLDVMDLAARVQLLNCEHANMGPTLSSTLQAAKRYGGLSAAVFNLGFLPGSDKQVVTESASTVQALDDVWPLIRPGGLLSVHTYSGHEGGEEEAAAVAHWMGGLPWSEAQVTACSQHNKADNPEMLYLVVKTPS